MKKYYAMIAAVAILLAGCSKANDDAASSESTTTTLSQAEQTTASSVTESETIPDGSDDTSDDTETEGGSAPEFDPDNVNPLQPLVTAAMGDFSNWPFLMEVTDEMILKDYFLLDKSNENYEELIVMQCPMSAQMCEIIIIKAKDVEAAKTDLEARQKKAQDTDAFYPADVENAANSIVGTKGDYAYFFIGGTAADGQTNLEAAIA